MPMERRLPSQENTLEDLIATMMANRTAELEKQEEQTARVADEAGLAPDPDPTPDAPDPDPDPDPTPAPEDHDRADTPAPQSAQ